MSSHGKRLGRQPSRLRTASLLAHAGRLMVESLERRGMLSASMGSLADSALVEMSGEASPIAVRAGRAAPPL